MEFLHWLHSNSFNELLQNTAIIAGLVFTTLSYRADTKARLVANRFEITKQHRDIWKEFYVRPQLQRVLDSAADLEAQPVSFEEELFVKLLVHHLASCYRGSNLPSYRATQQ